MGGEVWVVKYGGRGVGGEVLVVRFCVVRYGWRDLSGSVMGGEVQVVRYEW